MKFFKPGPSRAEQPGQPEAINRFQADGLTRTDQAEEEPSLSGAAPGNPLYRVLALYLPWSILLSLLPPALALIRRLLPDLNLPGSPALAAAVYIPVLLTGAAVTLYLEFLDPRTGHSGANIRGAVLACAAAYFFSSVLAFRLPLTPRTVTLRFLPSLGSVTAVLAALYMWIFVIYLRDLFRARELFEFHIRRFRGEDLRRAMLEDSAIMTAAETRGRSAGRYYGVQLGLAFLLVILCDVLGAPLSLFQRILNIFTLAAAALVFFLLGLFRQEQFFAGEGIAVPPAERGRRIGAGIAFSAAAALLAALCASDNNLLPISIIAAFFAWLARLLSRPGRTAAAPMELGPPAAPMEDPMAMLRSLAQEETEPWPIWDYLPYIALAAAIAAFLWFMVKPLFSLRPGKLPLLLRLTRLFLGGFASLRAALKNFLASLRGGAGIRINTAGEKVRDMTEELLGAWTKARKRELRQSLNLFARLILWGGREHQVSWKPSMGPGEYCALLTAALTRTAPGGMNHPGGTGYMDHEGGSLPPQAQPASGLGLPPPRGNGQEGSATAAPGETADSPAPPRRPRDPSAEQPRNPPAERPQAPPAEQPLREMSAAILRCGAIFEEALYGPRLPDKETRKEFRLLVEKITGARRG
ncbi:MAG: hypothetical protein LBB77_11025 [Treponema sp.]|jgi:hypothetical protein|nr:hypothetical protein [Treponema sp.]